MGPKRKKKNVRSIFTTVNRGDFEHFWDFPLNHEKLRYLNAVFCTRPLVFALSLAHDSVQSHPKLFKVTPVYGIYFPGCMYKIHLWT